MVKVKDNFELRQIAGSFVVLSVADAALDFNGMLTLNESGVILWKLLLAGTTREELAKKLTDEYEVSYEQALVDVDEFLLKLDKAGCIDLQ